MTTTPPIPPATDLIAQSESKLGYTPRRSIVLLGLLRGRASDSLRVDLPPVLSTSVKNEILALACRLTRVDSLALVVFADDPIDDPLHDDASAADDRLPATDTVRQLRSGLEAMGFSVGRSVCSTPSFWAEYGSGHPVRHSGRTATQVRSASRDAAGFPQKTIREAATLPPADPATAEAVAELVDSYLDRFPNADLPGHLASAAFAYARSAAEGRSSVMDIESMAGLIVLSQDPDRRPQLVAETAWNGDLMASVSGEPPATESAEHIIGLWRLLASVCPRTELVSVLTVLAWLHWMLGQSSFAAIHAEDALAIEPRQPFLRAFLDLLDVGALPDWIRRTNTPPRLRAESTPRSAPHEGSARSR